ncbi:Chemotaxis protein CheA [Ewingella americana]|uniref:Chemotaxis protein CheA n=1 Tax=Ewingella americana TaxID=41202 RepID=A0A377NDX9_9GAMM|nr:Chemotaxis protein CheA [Ewingella americana]
MSMDISDFYQTFFDEADELLADMEQHLLLLDPQTPDIEQLNAIFRAAHSIKGGAATFGFSVLQETTHLLENLLDGARRAEMSLSTDIINLFLETKDIMQEQLDAYKSSQDPDAESFEYICAALRQLALEAQQQQQGAPAVDLHVVAETPAASTPAVAATSGGLRILLSGLKEAEVPLMLEELGNLGEVHDAVQTANSVEATLNTTLSEDDISAVLCFVIEPEQISFSPSAANDVEAGVAEPETVIAQPVAPVEAAAPRAAPALAAVPDSAAPAKARAPKAAESTSIRVAVEKVDQLINLVGELVITQSMLAQRSDLLDPVAHSDLLNSMGPVGAQRP